MTTLVSLVAVAFGAGCGHQAKAPDPSLQRAVEQALCREAKASPSGSIVVQGRVLHGDDC